MNKQPPSATQRKAPKGPTKTPYTILAQLVQWIPKGLIPSLAEQFDIRYRTFNATSHVVALMYGQLSGYAGLNAIVDAAHAHANEWRRIRNVEPPARNTFSNANRKRNPAMAEALYWAVFKHLAEQFPAFTGNKRLNGFLYRVKRKVFIIDSTTLQLAMNAIDWARHRRKKAAAKVHLRYHANNALPAFAVVESAAHHDSTRAGALCADLKDGDILLGDRAYTDLKFLHGLAARGVFFVLREKANMVFTVVKNEKLAKPGKAAAGADVAVLADERVKPALAASHKHYPGTLRRVTARVLVDGRMREMRFLTNHLSWSPRTVAALYKARWGH